MLPTTPVLVFVECTDPAIARMHYESAIGVGTLFGRWDTLQARISPLNSSTVDLAIPDFRESDLELLSQGRGVVRVERFIANITLPSVKEARREYYHQHAA